jgi:hypothetical protein
MRRFVNAAALLLLSACATAGVKVSDEQATSFIIGQSTYSDVTARLGRPTMETITSDGTRTVSYSFVSTQARPESFIPYVGLLVGGADSETKLVMFRFNGSGKLIDTTRSSSQIGVGTGLFSRGQSAPRTDQPKSP